MPKELSKLRNDLLAVLEAQYEGSAELPDCLRTVLDAAHSVDWFSSKYTAAHVVGERDRYLGLILTNASTLLSSVELCMDGKNLFNKKSWYTADVKPLLEQMKVLAEATLADQASARLASWTSNGSNSGSDNEGVVAYGGDESPVQRTGNEPRRPSIS